MSLILEALRKSEAERRRAQAPDLFAPVQPAPGPGRQWPRAWLAAGACALLLAVALVAWRNPLLHRPTAGADASTAASARPATEAVAAAPAPTGRPESPRRLPPPATGSNARDANPAVRTDAGASGTPAAAAPAPAPAPVAATTARAPALGRPAPAAEAASAATPPRATPARDAAPAPPGPAATTAPMRLAELPLASRRELPPLKLSMHMWNGAADRRFVIIDGQRLAEGDRIGAVQVAGILRDGVLLDWNGQRLLMSLH